MTATSCRATRRRPVRRRRVRQVAFGPADRPGPALQGRAHRRPRRRRRDERRAGADHQHLHARASSPTSAAGRTCPAPASSARAPSSSPAWPAPTGAATSRTPMLTRIYGTAFAEQEGAGGAPRGPREGPPARPPPHRPGPGPLQLPREGPGFPFFHPKGMRLWNAMIDYWRAEHVRPATRRSARR